jgi:hypothetical protein
VVRAAVPEVPVTVTVYVPAGVPVLGEVVLLLLLHAGSKRISPSKLPTTTPPNQQWRRQVLLLIPRPKSANPETGSHVPYPGLGKDRARAVLTGRAVVLMIRVELTGALLGMVTGVVENAHVAPVGRPEQLREICEL